MKCTLRNRSSATSHNPFPCVRCSCVEWIKQIRFSCCQTNGCSFPFAVHLARPRGIVAVERNMFFFLLVSLSSRTTSWWSLSLIIIMVIATINFFSWCFRFTCSCFHHSQVLVIVYRFDLIILIINMLVPIFFAQISCMNQRWPGVPTSFFYRCEHPTLHHVATMMHGCWIHSFPGADFAIALLCHWHHRFLTSPLTLNRLNRKPYYVLFSDNMKNAIMWFANSFSHCASKFIVCCTTVFQCRRSPSIKSIPIILAKLQVKKMGRYIDPW